jgi:hypothetical protein
MGMVEGPCEVADFFSWLKRTETQNQLEWKGAGKRRAIEMANRKPETGNRKPEIKNNH